MGDDSDDDDSALERSNMSRGLQSHLSGPSSWTPILHVCSSKLDCSIPSPNVRLPHSSDVSLAALVYDFSGLRLLSCFYF
jgi:hypothetical protein